MRIRPHRRCGRRGAFRSATAGVCLLAGAAVLASSVLGGDSGPLPPHPTVAATSVSPTGRDDDALPAEAPHRIAIPAIGLDTVVEPVGLAEDGSVSMPRTPDHAGWYTGSPAPGEVGNAIVAGHLDSATGPAAFYGLAALSPGDRIRVARRDGSTAHFTVTGLEVWPADGFPSEEVYAPAVTPVLTILTCADWDRATRSYRANLVLRAEAGPP